MVPYPGEFLSTLPDVLNIVSTSPNVTFSGTTVAKSTLTVDGDQEVIISISCDS